MAELTIEEQADLQDEIMVGLAQASYALFRLKHGNALYVAGGAPWRKYLRGNFLNEATAEKLIEETGSFRAYVQARERGVEVTT